MKTLFLILLTALTWNSVKAQTWNQVNLGTTENLNKVYFVNDQIGFIVGNNGLLLKTINGGSSWETVALTVQHNLRTISFANEQVGFINGLKTTDGGITWVPQGSSEIYGLMYASTSNRILAGHGDSFDGKIYESVDGGTSWQVIYNYGNLAMFNDCDFVSADTGYISSWYAGHLFKTVDAGATWSEIVIDEVDGNTWSSDDYRSVAFPSQTIGLVTHQGGVLKTTNGGNTWSEIRPQVLNMSFYPQSILAISTTNYILVVSGNSIQFPKIYETIDGGNSWTESANTLENMSDIACSSNYCFAVGSNGTVYRKENSTASISENLTAELISIFPNPTSDILTVSHDKDITELRIYDLNGKLLECFTNSSGVIEIAHLNSGTYILELRTENGMTINTKFIKE